MTTATPSSMPALGVQRLLEHLIDYAGLFPPAKLDMGPTLANYARHRGSAHAWMLGRLIIPAGADSVRRLRQAFSASLVRSPVMPTGALRPPWRALPTTSRRV